MLASDDEFLDLRGSLVDLENLGVAHQLLHRVLAVEPVSTKNLNRVSSRLVSRVASE